MRDRTPIDFPSVEREFPFFLAKLRGNFLEQSRADWWAGGRSSRGAQSSERLFSLLADGRILRPTRYSPSEIASSELPDDFPVLNKALFSSKFFFQDFSNFLSYQILRHMH